MKRYRTLVAALLIALFSGVTVGQRQADTLAVNIDAANTEQQISTTELLVSCFIVVAANDNTTEVLFGASSDLSTNYFPLEPTESIGRGCDDPDRKQFWDLSDFYVRSATQNDDVYVYYELR